MLRVSLRHLLVAVEPGTDDSRMTQHRQRTRIVSLYVALRTLRKMLKLRLIFIEFRNCVVITKNCPNIAQLNRSVGINIIAQC